MSPCTRGRSPGVLLFIAFAIATASRPGSIEAQPDATNAEPPFGSLACYARAEEIGLEDAKSIRLCIGAASDAPARCFDEVVDRLGLADGPALRLCRAARTTAPADCAERLDGLGLESREIVGYCAALAWPLVPARTSGTPACIQAGLDRTFLTEREVIRLCRGSTSTAPIDCFETGEDMTFLDDRDLVRLCAPVEVSAPRAVMPPGTRELP